MDATVDPPIGCLAASGAAALVAALLTLTPAMLVPAFIVAGLHGLMLGLPAYRALARRRPGPAFCIAAGAAIGAFPVTGLMLAFADGAAVDLNRLFGGEAPGAALATLAQDAWAAFWPILLCAACGAAGGAVFWIAVRPDRAE